MFVEFAACLHYEFGRGRGSRGADVRYEICNGEIGFVAHPGDYGNFGGGDGAGDFFFVESPEIFERATAAGKDQNIDHFSAIEELHGAGDFGGRAIALDAHRIDGEVHIAEAAAQDANHIADSGSAGRSDQADTARQKRQRLFAISGEETFGLEALLELLESELQRTEPHRFDILDINLVFAT